MNYAAVSVVIAMVAVLLYLNRRDRVQIKATRSAFFDACLPLFQQYQVTQDGIYFPVLTGTYSGFDVKLEPIADHIVIRKIPSLWLLVTVKAEVPYAGILDFIVRPQNVEFYSPSAKLETRLPVPESWPQHAWLRTDRAADIPPLDVVGRHMDFFDDTKAKELVISPRGVRLVYQARQSVRAHYMVLRQVHFDDLVLQPELVRELLDRAIALHGDLRGTAAGVEHRDAKDLTG